MTKMKGLHAKWMKDPAYRREYEALEEEFTLIRSVIEAWHTGQDASER